MMLQRSCRIAKRWRWHWSASAASASASASATATASAMAPNGKRWFSSHSSQELIDFENQYSAHNYHPIPVVFSKGKDATVWDPEGRKYVDFLSAYSAVNQGHCHEKIVKALIEQVQQVTLSSRAFYNDKFPIFAKYINNLFGYEMVLPMNTGAEGVETALKLARKWGYGKKKIAEGEAIIVSCCGCFHGRTLGAISMSCDNEATRGFGPFVPGHVKVDFGDASGLKRIFEEQGDKIAGFLFEPIQGEAGVIMPPEGYLKNVRELCSKYNVLMIADEIQTGIGRTGKLLACDWESVRPDVVILGKALGGGVLPVSAVLADKDVMLCIKPGEHGSTFGGNPLASSVAIASLEVILEEKLAERASEMGQVFRKQFLDVQKDYPEIIKEVRGRGLLNAIELNSLNLSPVSAFDICKQLKERGILAKPTHNTIIRFSPPLTIRLEELSEASNAVRDVLELDLSMLREQLKGKASHVSCDPCDRCGRR